MENKEFNLDENSYYQMSLNEPNSNYLQEFWNIDETISELAYLTHDYFRYYGKFPSKVGKNIISDLKERNLINTNRDIIFDNYAGSGTSLVESKLMGFDSIGVDINPFGVLACNVKTFCLDNIELNRRWMEFSSILSTYIENPEELNIIGRDTINPEMVQKIENTLSNVNRDFPDITKWFCEENIRDLAVIKTLLLEMEMSEYREFFSLAFFAIIRRVSTSHDGEVRPHVNKKKRKRDVLTAYCKKVCEMIDTMREWNAVTSNNICSKAFLSDNRSPDRLRNILHQFQNERNKQLGLVISHPPYLNCFDYIPVYKLKFLWAFGFNEIYGQADYNVIKSSEIKSYPASTHKLIDQYFESNIAGYELIYDMLRPDGYCCIVIGDCTVKKQLFRVHKTFINMCENIGFTIEKVVSRSTHYGLGKYAYNFRADYHEEEEGKKDVIIFLRK